MLAFDPSDERASRVHVNVRPAIVVQYYKPVFFAFCEMDRVQELFESLSDMGSIASEYGVKYDV